MDHSEPGPVRSWTWQSFRAVQIGIWCLLLIGPAIAYQGIQASHRNRASLQWPAVRGTILHSSFESGWGYQGRRPRYSVAVAYNYAVNGRHYIGHRISLWNPDGVDTESATVNWAALHPIHMTVYVYYDPQHPENSVLEPGADEARNSIAIWCGSIIFVCCAWIVYRANRFFNKLVAWRKANPPKMPAARKHEKIVAYPHGFISYEPACKQKLNCFASRDELDQFLGNDDDKALQDWKPDDRIIDAKGQEYRLAPSCRKKHYNLESTGGTWTWENLLELAMADAEMLRKNPDVLRSRVTDAPIEDRIPVLMKCVDEQAMGSHSWPAVVALIVFLALFFVAVFFGVALLFALIGRWFLHSPH